MATKPNTVLSVDQLSKKLLLTLSEASAYTSIGRRNLERQLKKPECRHIVLKVGNRRLVRRAELETYLSCISSLPGNSGSCKEAGS